MAFILDTCVVSELVRPSPNANVVGWFDRNFSACRLASPVIMEIEAGAGYSADSVRFGKLRAVIDRIFRRFSASQRLVFDEAAAREAGKALAAAKAGGRPLGIVDAEIIGLAAALRCAVATRDAEFEDRGVGLVNPWKEGR